MPLKILGNKQQSSLFPFSRDISILVCLRDWMKKYWLIVSSYMTWARYTTFMPATLASRPGVDHFLTGDTDVPMRQRDCSWLPISRRETSLWYTRPQTPTLSCIIFTCHSCYPTFYSGDCAFVVAAASVWNKLPHEISSATSLPVFRRRLKTHLFDCVLLL